MYPIARLNFHPIIYRDLLFSTRKSAVFIKVIGAQVLGDIMTMNECHSSGQSRFKRSGGKWASARGSAGRWLATLILFALPWLDRCKVKSIRYRPMLHKVLIAVFCVSFVVLGWLGAQSGSLADPAYVASVRERAERAAHWMSHAEWTDRWDPHDD